MRQLDLTQTILLASLLALSLVLPLMMSFYRQHDLPAEQSSLRTVWLGQGLGTAAAVIVMLSAALAPYAAGFGVITCAACVVILFRQLRPIRTA